MPGLARPVARSIGVRCRRSSDRANAIVTTPMSADLRLPESLRRVVRRPSHAAPAHSRFCIAAAETDIEVEAVSINSMQAAARRRDAEEADVGRTRGL